MRMLGYTRAAAAALGLVHLLAGAAAPDQTRPAGAPAGSVTVEDLAWLSGHWVTGGEPRIEEHWTRPAGGTLLGMGRTVTGGRTVSFEYLRIEGRPGAIDYVAQPQGRPPTAFRLARLDASGAVFENPAHDFPKRITYRHNADGSMTARVDGGPGDEEKPQEFHFHASQEH